jgi:hypothetical protein
MVGNPGSVCNVAGSCTLTAVPSYFTTSGFADYDVRMAETSLPERRANV